MAISLAQMLVHGDPCEARKLQAWLQDDDGQSLEDMPACDSMPAFLEFETAHRGDDFGVPVKACQIRVLAHQFVRDGSQIPYVAVLGCSGGRQWKVAPFAPQGYSVPALREEIRTDMETLGVRVLQLWNTLDLPDPILRQSYLVGELTDSFRARVEVLQDCIDLRKPLPNDLEPLVGAVYYNENELFDPRCSYHLKSRAQFEPVRELVESLSWSPGGVSAWAAAQEEPLPEEVRIFDIVGHDKCPLRLVVRLNPGDGKVMISVVNASYDTVEELDGFSLIDFAGESLGEISHGRYDFSAEGAVSFYGLKAQKDARQIHQLVLRKKD